MQIRLPGMKYARSAVKKISRMRERIIGWLSDNATTSPTSSDRLRLLIYEEGGVIQHIMTPDNPEGFNVIVVSADPKADDNTEKAVWVFSVGHISEKDWTRAVEEAGCQESEVEDMRHWENHTTISVGGAEREYAKRGWKAYVDLPILMGGNTDQPYGECKHVTTFDSRQEAIEWCQEMWACDEEGRFPLVSVEPEECA